MSIKTESNEEYHASEAVGRSMVWAMETQTPYMARYGARKESHAFEFGTAAHIAILEPERLEASILKGPDDRRGNKWKEAEAEAVAKGMECVLTSGDFEMMLMIRDLSATVPVLNLMRKKEFIVETSAYAVDEETGLEVKCRPDLFSPSLRIGCDIKNMAGIGKEAWRKAVGEHGYMVQDAMYRDVWNKAAPEMPMEAFIFACFSKTTPPEVAVYELDAPTVAEGFARYRRGLLKYAECRKADVWPSHPMDVQPVGLRKWDYVLTPAPEGAE